MTIQNRTHKLLPLLSIALLLLFTACGPAYQIDEANKLVDKADGDIKAFNALQTAFNAKFKEYDQALDDEQIEKAISISDALVKDIDKGIGHLETASADLEKASGMLLPDKIKEYFKLKAEANRKRVESAKELKNIMAASKEMLKDGSEEAVEKAEPKIKAAQEKSAELEKEAARLEDQAEKVRKDNPDNFKN